MSQLHYVYLNSVNKLTGTNDSLQVSLPHGLMGLSKRATVDINLVTAVIPNSVLYVSSLRGNNRFRIGATQYTIPAGSYTMAQLTQAIQTAIGAAGNVTWQIPQNALQFSFATSQTVTFQDRCGLLLGFNNVAGDIAVSGTTITSTFPAQPKSISHFLVHVRGLGHATSQTMTNTSSVAMKKSDLLAAVANTADPFDTVNYHDSGDSHFVTLSLHHMGVLEVYITDQNGVPLTSLQDWSCTLKLAPRDSGSEAELASTMDRVADSLDTLVNYQKLTLLSQGASQKISM